MVADLVDLDLEDFAAAWMVVSRAAITTSNLNSNEYAKSFADMITVMTENIAREKVRENDTKTLQCWLSRLHEYSTVWCRADRQPCLSVSTA